MHIIKQDGGKKCYISRNEKEAGVRKTLAMVLPLLLLLLAGEANKCKYVHAKKGPSPRDAM